MSANPNAEDLAWRCSAALMQTLWASERDSAFRLCEQALEIDPENVRALSHVTFKFIQRFFFLAVPDPQADLRRADELASLAVKIDPGYHMAHAAKGDALLAAGRYREAIDSYERALMLAPSSIQPGSPWPTLISLSRNRPSPMRQGDADQSIPPRARWPVFYFAKAIAFGMLQDYEQALVWIERAEAAAPDILFMGFVRSALLALAGKEDEARAAMQRYLANDNAPIRTMSQWHARWADKPLPSYNPLVLSRLLIFGKKFHDGLRTAGLPE